MKKIVLLAAVAVFGMSTMIAQETSFGVKAGVNFAGVIGDDIEETDGRTGFHIGGVANIGINEWLAIQPEVVYSQQGYSFNDFDGVNDIKLDYINIPILADFTLAEGFSLQGGPQIGINVSSKTEFADQEIDLKDETESLEIATTLGAQYELPIGLFFQARYTVGFTNFIEERDGANNDAQNAVLSVSIGYFFN